jgi:phosphatidylserine synthase
LIRQFQPQNHLHAQADSDACVKTLLDAAQFSPRRLPTLANAACGVGAILLVMMYVGNVSVAHYLAAAAALVLAGLVFDVFEGRIARWRHSHSPLGRELDSLADIVSLGVAPLSLLFLLSGTLMISKSLRIPKL